MYSKYKNGKLSDILKHFIMLYINKIIYIHVKPYVKPPKTFCHPKNTPYLR